MSSDKKLRKAIPIIGTKTSQKSIFVDNLLGLNLLKKEDELKFVLIIKHNKELSEPKFYHIKFSEYGKDQKTGIKEYEIDQEGDIIIGYENIIEKIKNINEELKSINIDNIKYDDLFYVLELKISNIKKEELLNNYDFYDIPILDKYILENEKDEKKKLKNIENIFKYFKSRIDFGIFVINDEKNYIADSKDIIINISNVIKPKRIQNYLFILNITENKEDYDNDSINEVKSILVNDLLDQINLPNNIFIQLNSNNIKHYNLSNKNFSDYLLLLFNQYISQSKINSFYNYINNFIIADNNTEKESYINNLISKFDENGYNYDEIDVKNIFEGLNNNMDLNLENEESIKLFKALYIIFKDQIKVPFSQEVYDLYEYFNNIINIIKSKGEELDSILPFYIINQQNLIDVNFFDKFDQLIQTLESDDEQLENSISDLYNSVFYQQFFYIRIYGNNILELLNNILGYDLLEFNEHNSKRGIIFEEGEDIELFKAKSDINYLCSGKSFMIFKKVEKIVSGLNNVKEYLSILNSQFSKNKNMIKYDYFIITFPIKFFDDVKLDKNLRKIIKFIYLPENIPNKETYYERIINCFSLNIFNFNNNEIDNINKSMNDNELNNFLFNINLLNNDVNNTNELKIKIKNIINKDNNDINISYINSISCQKYLNYYKLFCDDYQILFDDILKEYHHLGLKNSFSEFFLNQIKLYINELFTNDFNEINNIIAEENYNNNIYEKINNLFENNQKEEKNIQENIKCISSGLTYIKNNITKIKYYNDSYIELFYKDLSAIINTTINTKMKNLLDIFNSCVKNFENYFKYDEEHRILNFTKNFDSFYNLFEGYKVNNFKMPKEILLLKKSIDNRSDYYKLKKEARGFGNEYTHGNSNTYNWANGILSESDKPKVYMKKYEKKCDGKPFQKVTIYLDENFDDIIVGWRIESCWCDGTNGEWFMEENPLLSNKFKCKFVTQLFRGQRFNIYIYLMKYPE